MNYLKDSSSLVAPYKENAALQLIAFTGLAYISFHGVKVAYFLTGSTPAEVFSKMNPAFGLGSWQAFTSHPWVIFSFGFLHNAFWDWLSNMIWLFLFGSIFQKNIHYKELFPLYIIGTIAGGIFHVLGQLWSPALFYLPEGVYFMGAQPAILAIATAMFACNPGAKWQLSGTFKIPVYILYLAYLALTIISYLPFHMYLVPVLLGGCIAGLSYSLILKAGKRPGIRIYQFLDAVFSSADPDQHTKVSPGMKKRNPDSI